MPHYPGQQKHTSLRFNGPKLLLSEKETGNASKLHKLHVMTLAAANKNLLPFAFS